MIDTSVTSEIQFKIFQALLVWYRDDGPEFMSVDWALGSFSEKYPSLSATDVESLVSTSELLVMRGDRIYMDDDTVSKFTELDMKTQMKRHGS